MVPHPNVICGDSLAVLKTLADNSLDSCVTDPPYGINFMGKCWDGPDAVAFSADFWREVYRVLKPGAHLVAFGGTRTYHRLVCAVEDAGFEVRDQLAWMFGTGFPKSLDVSKAIDRAAGAEREVIGRTHRQVGPVGSRKVAGLAGGSAFQENPDNPGNLLTAPATDDAREWEGWGTALKPAFEPVVLARKPLSEKTVAANVLRWGTGALNIDASRVGWATPTERGEVNARTAPNSRHAAETSEGVTGWGSGRVRSKEDLTHAGGRRPANVCHDGSDDVVAAFPVTTTHAKTKAGYATDPTGAFSPLARDSGSTYPSDSGSAARFFYAAKASAKERVSHCGGCDQRFTAMPSCACEGAERRSHPTVKPVALMEWLVRMVTPPGGTVLDPFAGTGSTGVAAKRLGFNATLIEREADYVDDIRFRLAA